MKAVTQEEEEEEFTVLKRTSNIRHNKDIKAAIQSAGSKSNNEKNVKNDKSSNNSQEVNEKFNKLEKNKNSDKLQNTNIEIKKNLSFSAINNASDLVLAVRSASMTNSENKKKCRAANAHCVRTGARGDVSDRSKNLDEGVIEVFRSFRSKYSLFSSLIFLFAFLHYYFCLTVSPLFCFIVHFYYTIIYFTLFVSFLLYYTLYGILVWTLL